MKNIDACQLICLIFIFSIPTICMFLAFMLNLPIAMFLKNWFSLALRLAPLWVVFLLLAAQVSFVFADDPGVGMDLPKPGEALQGVVTIHGTTEAAGFRSAEISFAYDTNPTSTWFLIQQTTKTVKNGALASWDTTTITDGNYQLRLQVTLQDGQLVEKVVKGLRVRNYQPVETSTPAPVSGEPVVQEVILNTSTPLPDFQVQVRTPATLPTNSAQITQQELQASAFTGVGVVIGALAAAGIYLWLRAVIRR